MKTATTIIKVKTQHGITFVSNEIDVERARISDLFAIAFTTIIDDEIPTNKEIADLLKSKGVSNVKIVRDKKLFKLNAIFS